jgi:hypothetical protein
MKEINNIIYPRTIPEVRDLIRDPNIHLDCTGCDNCRLDNIVPCSNGMEGISEVGIGVMCMDKKVQITGQRIETAEVALELPSTGEEVIIDLADIQASEIEH